MHILVTVVLGAVFILGVVTLGTLSTLLKAWVLTVLWGWFIPPVFTQLPALTLLQALGIIFIVSFLKFSDSSDSKDTETFKRENLEVMEALKKSSKLILRGFLTPLIFLGLGYILKLVALP